MAGPAPGPPGPAGCLVPATGAASHPPALRVLTRAASAGAADIFITPQGCGTQAGPEIVSQTGKVIWFRPVPPGQFAADLRTQAYEGRPVLTWFQGSGLTGTDYICNDHYQLIAAVRAGHCDDTDFHEFLITPWKTALILADAVGTANLTSMGGPARQRVFDGIVQEIDIRSGKVVLQWRCWTRPRAAAVQR